MLRLDCIIPYNFKMVFIKPSEKLSPKDAYHLIDYVLEHVKIKMCVTHNLIILFVFIF